MSGGQVAAGLLQQKGNAFVSVLNSQAMALLSMFSSLALQQWHYIIAIPWACDVLAVANCQYMARLQECNLCRVVHNCCGIYERINRRVWVMSMFSMTE